MAGLRPASSPICSILFSNQATSADTFGTTDQKVYLGSLYTFATSANVCSFQTKLIKSAGDISAISYKVQIYTLSANNLNTLVGESDSVLGDNSWSATWVTFPVTVPFSVAAGTSYAIVITSGTYDASNYASGYYAASTGWVYRTWKADKTLAANNNNYFVGFTVSTQ